MDGNARQRAYDRGHTIFSPDGRLYQVEYAREAVERGSPSVGVRTDDGVVLAARKRLRSPLLEADTVEKVHGIDDHVAVASAGHAADARRLVDVARETAQRHRVRYGEPIPVRSLTTAVADHVQEHTQSGGARPYGTALLVGGVDGDGPALLEVDPSGTPYGWRAAGIGDGADEIRGFLETALSNTDGDGPPDTDGDERPDAVDGSRSDADTHASVPDGPSAADGSDSPSAADGSDSPSAADLPDSIDDGVALAVQALTDADDVPATELAAWIVRTDPAGVEPLSDDAIRAHLDG